MYIFSIGQLYFRLAGRSSYKERSSRLAQFICMGKAMTYNLALRVHVHRERAGDLATRLPPPGCRPSLMTRSSRWLADSTRSAVIWCSGMPLVPTILAVPSYRAFQLAATSLPRRETATRRHRSLAGSPLTLRLILVPAGVAFRRAWPCTPVAWSVARKPAATGLVPILVNTPIAAAATAVTTVASQRRPALVRAGPTARSTGPLIRRLAAARPVLSWVSQSLTGSSSSYSVRQPSHERR